MNLNSSDTLETTASYLWFHSGEGRKKNESPNQDFNRGGNKNQFLAAKNSCKGKAVCSGTFSWWLSLLLFGCFSGLLLSSCFIRGWKASQKHYLILANHLDWKNHFWQICSHRHSYVLMQGCVHPCAEDRLFHGEDSVKRKSRFHLLRLRCSFLVSETNFGAHNLSFFL